MVPALAILFIVVPLAELAVIITVGKSIGVLTTLLLLLAFSLSGAWLAKREGLGVWRRINEQVQAGKVPGVELVDAFLILLAGALLLTPGFISDVFAIFLLLPPSRAVVRRTLRRRFMGRVDVFRGGSARQVRPPPDIDV